MYSPGLHKPMLKSLGLDAAGVRGVALNKNLQDEGRD